MPADHPALASADDKLQPGEVPEVEFTGTVKMPETDGLTLLVFGTEDDTAIGVRVDDDELRAIHKHIGASVALEDEPSVGGDGE